MKRKIFVDGETQSKGVFYLVQRLVGSLPDYVDMEVSATLKKQISDILVDNTDPENRIKVKCYEFCKFRIKKVKCTL